MTVYARQRFAAVLSETWTDADFLALGPAARLLFIWSWTQPRATACGLYVATIPEMGAALGPPQMENLWLKHLENALWQLGRKPMVLYHEPTSVLWVVNRARHSNTSPRAQRLMAAEYHSCPPSPLKAQFLTQYRQLLQLGRSPDSVRPGG